ncbi:MAG: transposase [Methanotrichaceae archaeon]
MLSPLIPDIKHPKWIIAIKILEIIASPRAKKIAGRLKISDIDNFLLSIKLLVLSDLFERNISNLISEINVNLELRELLKINSRIKPQSIYKLHSNLDYTLTYSFFKKLFSAKRIFRKKKSEIIIIDTTSIVIDLNIWRNKHRIGKKNKKYNYAYDHSRGYYVGFKLILAINQDLEVLGFEIHKDSPHDSKLLVPFVEKLFRSRMIKPRDIIVCDKGFTSKQNYRVLINRFYVIPIIYPKINTNLDKVIDSFNPPLDIFFSEKNKMKLWLKIVSDFKKLIVKWENFKLIGSEIEDLFNIAKNSLGMKQIHQYTKLSVEKKVARIIFLSQKLVYLFDEQNIEKKAIPFL